MPTVALVPKSSEKALSGESIRIPASRLMYFNVFILISFGWTVNNQGSEQLCPY